MDIQQIQKQFDLYSNMSRALSEVLAGFPLHPDLLKRLSHDINTCLIWVEKGLQAFVAAQQASQQAAPQAPAESPADGQQAAEPAKAG